MLQEKLSQIFPQLKITVEKKADSLFPIVSAASICAKVTRDIAVQNWVFAENISLPEDQTWGSGYPAGNLFVAFLRKVEKRQEGISCEMKCSVLAVFTKTKFQTG